MEFFGYGVNYKHSEGEFCSRTIAPSYFFSCFLTDYVIEINGALVRGEAGDMFLARRGDIIYHGSLEGCDGFANDWIYFDGDDVGRLLSDFPLPIGVPFKTGGINRLRVAIESINKERAFMKEGYPQMCDAIMTEAIIKMYRDYRSTGIVSPYARLENVRGAVMRDFRREWRVSDMAELSGYSQSRFLSLYKTRFGVSPILDLTRRRIDEAKILLLYGNMSIAETAEAVGYSSIYYFSRIFKEHTGLTPTEFKTR